MTAERSAVIVEPWRYLAIRDSGKNGKTASLGMINPAMATATKNDHTLRKVEGFGERLGISRWIIWNPFAFRTPNVSDLAVVEDPVGPDNDRYIRQALSEADLHIAAWGSSTKVPKRLRHRFEEVLALARDLGIDFHCIGTTKRGEPRHPLMTPYDTPMTKWDPILVGV